MPARSAQQEAKLMAISLQRDQRELRDYLARRGREPARWRRADIYMGYTLSVTAEGARRSTRPARRADPALHRRHPRGRRVRCRPRPARRAGLPGCGAMTALRDPGFRRLWVAGLISDTRRLAAAGQPSDPRLRVHGLDDRDGGRVPARARAARTARARGRADRRWARPAHDANGDQRRPGGAARPAAARPRSLAAAAASTRSSSSSRPSPRCSTRPRTRSCRHSCRPTG